MYEWMTVAESVKFTKGFHENWDDAKAESLLKRFGLPLNNESNNCPAEIVRGSV